MAKKETTILQLIISLTGITIVAALALSGVYLVTKNPIEKIKIEKNNAAKIAVLPGFDADEGTLTDFKVLPEGLTDSLTVTLAFVNNELFGAAVATYTNMAFSGRFDIMVGFDKEGNILNTELLKHNETPGLGDRIDKKKGGFSLQFAGKNPNLNNLTVKKDGGEVDAITAATISSRAFCNAVKNAYQGFQIALKNVENLNNNDTLITEKEENYE